LWDLAVILLAIVDTWAASFTFSDGPVALPGIKPRGVRVAWVLAGPVDVTVWWPIAWPLALLVVKPGGVRVATIVAAGVVPAGKLQLGHGGGQGQAAAAWLRLGQEGGRRQLHIAGRTAFCNGGEMELVSWIASVFREIDLGAMNAVVKGKLN
jgi:hypothetical protein